MKKTELSRSSPKRAKLIKEGLKTNGTFTIDVASIRARQGAMSSKVADTLFGKAKGRKKSSFKPRKATGEAKVFAVIWEEREHVCEVCKVYLHEATAGNFSHLLNKGTYPEFQLDPRNSRIKCQACHDLWHQHGASGLRWSFPWREVIAIYDELRQETKSPMRA